jgi:hypothetical protein
VNRARLAGPAVVAVIAFVAAWLALLPGLSYWDTGELQTVGPLLGTAHPTGFPTYVILGWLASVVLQPFGEPAFRMNLLSALCVAVAAGVTVDLVRALTRSTLLGVMAGLGLALTPVVWAIATHAEAHALHLALVAILLRLLIAWEDRVRPAATTVETTADAAPPDARTDRGNRYLVAATVVFGLAVGNHSLTLLLAIPVGLFVLAVDSGIWRRWRLVLGCLAALAITVVVVYAELPLRAGIFRAPLVYGAPDTWDGFWYVTLAEQFRGSLYDPFGDLPRKFVELVTRTTTQFGILAPLLPFAFVATALRRPRYALLTGSAALITCFFSASYVNADIDRYYLGPVLIAWTWLAILASLLVDLVAVTLGEEDERDEGAVDALAATEPGATEAPGATEPPGATARGLRWSTIAAVGIAGLFLSQTLVAIPGRYDRVNASHDTGAQAFADQVMAKVEPNAVIVSWWSYSTPLWYAQLVEGQQPGVKIVDDRTRLDEHLGEITDVIDANLGTRPVYVIRLDQREVAGLAARYDLDYIGNGHDATALTRVIGRKAGGS